MAELLPQHMTFSAFRAVAVCEKLQRHGRDWEVFLHGQSLGFADGTHEEALRQTHEAEVNNSLYANAAGAPEWMTRPLPTAEVLKEYPHLVERFPDVARTVLDGKQRETMYDALRTFDDVKVRLETVTTLKGLEMLNEAVEERIWRDREPLILSDGEQAEWTTLVARKAAQIEHEQEVVEAEDSGLLADVRRAAEAYRESRSVDHYEYDQKLREIQAEIEQDWAQGNSDAYSYRYGPDEIRAQIGRERNPEHFDADGDLTDAGWKRRDELEGELSVRIARDVLGDPKRREVDLSRPDHMAEFLHWYLEENGFDPHAVGGSGKSLSKYFDVPVGEGDYRTIRISDHKLPSEYGPSDLELPLYDVSGCDVRADGREMSVGIDESEAIQRAVGLIEELSVLKARGAVSAFLEAQRNTYSAVDLDTSKGDYCGPFVFANDCYAVQALGRGSVAIHDVRRWESKPVQGQHGTIRYRGDEASVALKTPNRERGKGGSLSLG